jgi:hypothetical protein
MTNFLAMLAEGLQKNKERKEKKLSKLSPIPCLGITISTMDGTDYDCQYAEAGGFGCEDCIVNEGRMDPRTGREYNARSIAKRKNKKSS